MLRIHIYYHSFDTMHTNPIKDLHLDGTSSFSMSLLWTRQRLSTGCHISMSTIGPKGKTIIVFGKIEYLKYISNHVYVSLEISIYLNLNFRMPP